MFNMMQKLISKHFYETKNEAHDKLDTFFAVGRITDEQYTELSTLTESVYGESDNA